jgi:NAD dependent epimerase/dehydratase
MSLPTLAGKRVLVTGSAGFIGSHLVERLSELGADVRAFVHYNALGSAGWLDHSPVRDGIEVRFGDITDRDSVRDAVGGCEIVFHLAALISIPYSYIAPESYLRTNALGTMNVLQSAREVSVSRIVHVSTSEVYGTARFVPITEDHPLHGQSPYSASKIAADKVAESFHLSFGVPVVTVRPFNTYGPRQSGRAIVPTIITQALAGGGRLRLGNLTPTRDLNFVSDTVEGFVCAALADAAIGCTINLGSGREISIGALVALIARMIGVTLDVDTAAERVRPSGSEVERLLADTNRAEKLLGWTSRTDLETGLALTIDWLGKHADHYRPGSYLR